MECSDQKKIIPSEREIWFSRFWKLVEAPLSSASDGTLKRFVETKCKESQRPYVALEVLGRVLCGAAPWLSCPNVPEGEHSRQQSARIWSLEALSKAVSSDLNLRLNFEKGGQPLVDTALLVIGVHRGRSYLWENLEASEKLSLISAIKKTRRVKPSANNWLLFSAVIEGFLASIGESYEQSTIDRAIQSFEKWYLGDGIYGDGSTYVCDYYNSFMIHPILLTLAEMNNTASNLISATISKRYLDRASRYAEIQERCINSDGSFALHGRSITYRCGTFHHLAHMAWRGLLPDSLSQASVRGGLGAVINWCLDPIDTYDNEGWLQIGLRGKQEFLAENYISNGSGYFCTTAFLPLGLETADPFWSSPSLPWTSRGISDGLQVSIDHCFDKSFGAMSNIDKIKLIFLKLFKRINKNNLIDKILSPQAQEELILSIKKILWKMHH
jgi:hypothetical protein